MRRYHLTLGRLPSQASSKKLPGPCMSRQQNIDRNRNRGNNPAAAIDEANGSATFQRGANVVMFVFGAGLTRAYAAMKW